MHLGTVHRTVHDMYRTKVTVHKLSNRNACFIILVLVAYVIPVCEKSYFGSGNGQLL